MNILSLFSADNTPQQPHGGPLGRTSSMTGLVLSAPQNEEFSENDVEDFQNQLSLELAQQTSLQPQLMNHPINLSPEASTYSKGQQEGLLKSLQNLPVNDLGTEIQDTPAKMTQNLDNLLRNANPTPAPQTEFLEPKQHQALGNNLNSLTKAKHPISEEIQQTWSLLQPSKIPTPVQLKQLEDLIGSLQPNFIVFPRSQSFMQQPPLQDLASLEHTISTQNSLSPAPLMVGLFMPETTFKSEINRNEFFVVPEGPVSRQSYGFVQEQVNPKTQVTMEFFATPFNLPEQSILSEQKKNVLSESAMYRHGLNLQALESQNHASPREVSQHSITTSSLQNLTNNQLREVLDYKIEKPAYTSDEIKTIDSFDFQDSDAKEPLTQTGLKTISLVEEQSSGSSDQRFQEPNDDQKNDKLENTNKDVTRENTEFLFDNTQPLGSSSYSRESSLGQNEMKVNLNLSDLKDISNIATERARDAAAQLNAQNGSAKIQVNHTELGKINIDVHVVGNNVSIEMNSESPEVKKELERNKDKLKESLEKSKLNLNEFNVAFEIKEGSKSNTQSYGDSSKEFQQNFQQNQYSSQRGHQDSPSFLPSSETNGGDVNSFNSDSKNISSSHLNGHKIVQRGSNGSLRVTA